MSNSPQPTEGPSWRATLLDALLPEDCALCGLPSEHGAVCVACTAELPRHGQNVCPRCGDSNPGESVCGTCLREPPHLDATRAAFAYRFPIDRLVQRFKYGGQLQLARWWADQCASALDNLKFDLIVPMPLHRSRLAERGFNQAVEIARPLSARVRIPMRLDLCTRNRATPPQADIGRAQRLKNVRGAFSCQADLSGKDLLLVDDVMTTGASLDELARTLKLHGARTATALVGARTLSR